MEHIINEFQETIEKDKTEIQKLWIKNAILEKNNEKISELQKQNN